MKSGAVETIRTYLSLWLHPAAEQDFLRWERELYESSRWRPRALLRRYRSWVTATRRRRWTAWFISAVLVLLVLPAVIGAIATAQTTTVDNSVSSINSALSWTDVRDTSGVPVSSYVFASAGESIFHPIRSSIVFVIFLVFEGWIVIVVTGVWVIGYGLSFKWLNIFGVVLIKVSDQLSGQIVTTIVLLVGATTGAFIVAYFVVRGFHAKATMQIATMLLIGVIGPLYLAHPLSEVMASDGLLAQGRDLGVSVAAGLNGTATNDPIGLVSTLQTGLADNFIRRPLQVWNFGHVIDTEPGCKAAWSSAVSGGSDTAVKDAMKSCGDGAAYHAANNPGVGQIGAGIILLIAGGILLLFGVYLAIKVIKAALAVIWSGFLAIVGFAGVGFIYGPPQIFLVRSIVDGFIAAGEMAFYVIFTGMYTLFMGDLFEAAGEQMMSVFVIGAIVEIVAILQLRKIGGSMERAKLWTTNRLGLAIQGAGGGGGGGGGGFALGMGSASVRNSLSGMAAMGNMNTLASNPLLEWMMLGTPGFGHPMARRMKKMNKYQSEFLTDPNVRGKRGTNAQGIMYRESMLRNGKKLARRYGGINTYLGAGAIFNSVEPDGDIRDAVGAARAAGFKNKTVDTFLNSWSLVRQGVSRSPMANQILSDAYSAATHFENQAKDFVDGRKGVTRDDMLANGAVLMTMARRNRSMMPGGRGLTSTPQEVARRGELRDIAEYINRNPDGDHIKALHMLKEHPTTEWKDWKSPDKANFSHVVDEINRAVGPNVFEHLTGDDATRLLSWLGNESAKNFFIASRNLLENPEEYDRLRDVRSAVRHMKLIEGDPSAAAGGTGGVAANPRGTASHPPGDWVGRMGALKGGFGNLDNYVP